MENFIGKYWRPLSNGKIECYLCPRHCTLQPSQRGFCFVRQNVDNQIVLTTYGRSSGFCIDPIEKKPLNHFYPGTSVLSFGTSGCNLGCKFCQNWNISKSREWDKASIKATPEMIARTAKHYLCKSVAFTYNDPVIFMEYALDIADACHALGIKTVAVTAGYISVEARPEFFSKMDAANVDLKAFSQGFYRKLTLSNLQPVLDTLYYLRHETKVWLEITTLLIPGENDSDKEIHALCEWIIDYLGADVPLHFTAFHPDFKLIDHPNTPHATLLRARNIALSTGLHYVYVGNVFDKSASSTYCPNCGNILIERKGYELGEYNIKNGLCTCCDFPCNGHFDNEKGAWGSRRLPVYVNG